MKYTNSSCIKRTEAVEIIAERLCSSDETKRQAKDRVNHRIRTAIDKGKLIQSQDGCFLFNDLAIWARFEWPHSFNDWLISATAESEARVTTYATADAVILPGSLESCHEVIRNMHETITILEKKLEAANFQIEQLLPGANQWRELQRRNKANAIKSRK
ncbi:hypothetical protein [Nitrosomonas sp.]|uniref:hypothetical protein n=1 Tax=Nitrosomonas sp. TaxID=42353 RepID=UPI00374D5408